jgi:hypothetical protein
VNSYLTDEDVPELEVGVLFLFLVDEVVLLQLNCGKIIFGADASTTLVSVDACTAFFSFFLGGPL